MRLPWRDKPSPLPSAPSQGVDVAVPSLGNGLTRPIRPEDYPALLETLRAAELPDAGTEFYVDWDGIRTRVAMLPFAPAELAGRVNTTLPIPDDGYRSEDVEYAALAAALASASDTFRIVEIGAGWAPWAVAGIVQARRRGLRASGIAVEADVERSRWALQHAADNDVTVELVEGTPEEIAARLAEPSPGSSCASSAPPAGTPARPCSSPCSTRATWEVPSGRFPGPTSTTAAPTCRTRTSRRRPWPTCSPARS